MSSTSMTDGATIDWDPEIDSPAVIAILGAGPIGIEAALYARFLGYFVLVFDQAKVGQGILDWGNVRMATPFAMNRSNLGLAALRAQDEQYQPPDDGAFLTGKEYVDSYVVPLAKTDLIYDNVHVFSRVVSVSRVQSQKSDRISGDERGGDEFRILINSRNRGWWTARADIVLDTTGNQLLRAACGPGLGQALGEEEFRSAISYEIPSLLPPMIDIEDVQKYSGKHTLVIGNGLSAALTVESFVKLIERAPATKLSWSFLPDENGKPTLREEEFAGRGELLELAKKGLAGSLNQVIPIESWGIEKMAYQPEQGWQLTLLTGLEETLDWKCDHLIQHGGRVPDWSFADPLRIDRCEALSAPRRLASKLHAAFGNSADRSLLPASLQSFTTSEMLTTEPHYYVLGAKSFGTVGGLSIAQGLDQVRAVFALIGGREDLNLHSTIR